MRVSYETARELGFRERHRVEVRNGAGATVMRFENLLTEDKIALVRKAYEPRGYTVASEVEELEVPADLVDVVEIAGAA